MLNEINDWYEEEGFNANISVLENKMNLLKESFTQVDLRKSIENSRNLAIEKYNKELKGIYEEAKRILSKKPWVEEHYNKTFLKDMSEIISWFAENIAKQSKFKLYEVNYLLYV